MVRKTVKEKFSDHVLGPRFISMQDFGKTKYNFLYIMPHFLSTREITFFSPKVLSFRENHFRNTEDVLFLSLSFLLFFWGGGSFMEGLTLLLFQQQQEKRVYQIFA